LINRRVEPGESIVSNDVASENTRNILNAVQGIIEGNVEISPAVTAIDSPAEIINPIENVLYRVGDTLAYWNGTEFRTIGGSGGAGGIDAVNGDSGPFVVLDADDIDDSTTSNKFVTASQKVKIDNLQGVNTGDETSSSIQFKRPIKSINNQSLEGVGDVSIEVGGRVDSVIGGLVSGTDTDRVIRTPDADDITDVGTINKFVNQEQLEIINGISILSLKNGIFTYNGDNLEAITYDNGDKKSFLYNSDNTLDRILLTISGSTSSKQFVYDANGRIIQIIEN
jgi:hypothetical protein